MTGIQENLAVKLIVTIAINRHDEVLLVKYASPADLQTGWILPNHLVGNGQHPNDAASRILAEEFSLTTARLDLSHVDSFIGHDGTWHIPLHYVVKIEEKEQLNSSVNIIKTRWFTPKSLPPLAEQSHGGWSGQIINELVSKGWL